MLPETRLAPKIALHVFHKFRRTHGFNPELACAMHKRFAQPTLVPKHFLEARDTLARQLLRKPGRSKANQTDAYQAYFQMLAAGIGTFSTHST